MIECEHLQVFDLELILQSPLYVGSGRKYTPTEYVFKGNSVRVLDRDRFFAFLLENGLADAYESFILSGQRKIVDFLMQQCGLRNEEINNLCLYDLDAADALDENHSLKEIHQFCRGADNRAYVPGSGVKGALRTALLTKMILDEEQVRGQWPNEIRKGKNAQQMRQLEAEYLNTLKLKAKNPKDKYDAVNDIMRGISISDSLPIPAETFILVGKEDLDVNGETQNLNLCRECVKPGTKLHFKLTLDQSVLKGRITEQTLLDAVYTFDRHYEQVYLEQFDRNQVEAEIRPEEYLILGGGSGFFSKTVAYPYLWKDALYWVSEELDRQFPDKPKGDGRYYRHHDHKGDPERGISPHMLKYGRYQGKLYHYGICEVKIT